MKKLFARIVAVGLLLLSAFPAYALNNVDCKNFAWTTGSPADFTYDPSLPRPSFTVQYSAQCEYTQTSPPPNPAFNIAPVTLKSNGQYVATYTAPDLSQYTLNFGFYAGGNCSSIIQSSGGNQYQDSAPIPWPTASAKNTYYTFTSVNQYNLGVSVCPIVQTPWPRPGVYKASIAFEYSVWSEGQANVHSFRYWPDASLWDISPGSLPVDITVPGACSSITLDNTSITTITYTPWGSAQTGSPIINARVRCNVDFKITFDTYSGKLAGVNYDLVVKDHNTQQTVAFGQDANSVNQTWTGSDQLYDISAVAGAGQSGDCSATPPSGCPGQLPAQKVHRLIVNY